MLIIFSDAGGVLLVTVDIYGIQFCDGFAYFSNGEEDFKVPITSIREIHH